MVAGAPQRRLNGAARGEPADGGQHQKDLLVGAPGQGAGDLLRSGRGIASDRTRDRDIRLSRPDGDRKVWPAKGTGSDSSCYTHGSSISNVTTFPTRHLPRGFTVLSQASVGHGGPCPWSAALTPVSPSISLIDDMTWEVTASWPKSRPATAMAN